MKVGLILPNNIWFCPYVNIYISELEKAAIDYEIISWNRDGRDGKIGYQYENSAKMSNVFDKLLGYVKYANFVKGVLNHHPFDRLIVFCPQVGIFLANYLKKHYSNRYIFDFRDLSIEQMPIFARHFRKLLSNSFANVISSPGFKKKLPADVTYILSHNFDVNLVRKALAEQPDALEEKQKEKVVLTIGGIRDYDSNAEVIAALSNQSDVLIKFVGRGDAAEDLQHFAENLQVKNISFEGYYPKEKESEYILGSTFLNIYYPKIISHSTALSNRFYNALIYKRPMIVTSNSIQGDYVEKYHLGISVDSCDGLKDQIDQFMNHLDYEEFKQHCNVLLREFLSDYNLFESTLKNFLSTK